MPYANGPLHLGHLAGAHLPADIYSRWMGMLIGRENVLFVNGTDDHGSTSEVSAAAAGIPIRQFIDDIHARQQVTLARYAIGVDVYTGTSQPETFPIQKELCDFFLTRLHGNGMLEKRTSRQWYDPQLSRFLPDRLVRGTCPNPKCNYESAYSDECDRCGHQHEPTALINPKSVLSNTTPEMRDTVHWFLDMWKVSEVLRVWIEGKAKKKAWRPSVIADTLEKVLPSLRFDGEHEEAYKALKATLPAHKSKYAPGKKVVLQFGDKAALETGRTALAAAGIPSTIANEWAHRSITRDIAWGVPVPPIDPDLAGKTLYVWPDSLIAPIAFSKVALAKKGLDPETYAQYWRDPEARVTQFLGQDNVFFYVLMQGAMWLGTQDDPQRMPLPGELQLTDIVSAFHLMVSGEKMSKSTRQLLQRRSAAGRERLRAGPDSLLPGAARAVGEGVGLRVRQAGRAQPFPGRSAQRCLRAPHLGGALEVRRPRPRRCAGGRRAQRHRADGPALREVDGPRRLPEHALRGGKLRAHHQQPLRAVQTARRSTPGRSAAQRPLQRVLRAEEPDDHALPLRARDHGPAAGVAAVAGWRV